MTLIHYFVFNSLIQQTRISPSQVVFSPGSLSDKLEPRTARPSLPRKKSASPNVVGWETAGNASESTTEPESAQMTSPASSESPQPFILDIIDNPSPIDDEIEEAPTDIDKSLLYNQSTSRHSPVEQALGIGESYFEFFLLELSKCFPYVSLFPWAAAKLFDSSIHNPALRESVLAVAALISDNNLGQGRPRALHHLHNALQILQNRISTVEIDQGTAIGSFLLAHFSIMLGDHNSARYHLKGMLDVLTTLDPESMREAVLSPLTIDPLTMLIWRMAKRIDFITSIASGKAPVLPR